MPPKEKSVRVWRPNYAPFILGGDVNQPVCTNLVPDEVLNLGKGVRVGVFNHPRGGRVVFEMSSGGVVGQNVNTVRNDFETGATRVIRQQILDAVEQGKKARMVDIEEFFKPYRK